MESAGTRRSCFIEQGHGLALDVEAGFAGHPFLSRSLCSSSRMGSFRTHSFGRVSSPRPRFEEHQPHFLEACFLCKKQLGDNRDIFMYRGDTPFCSEECRQEQIEIDEAAEKNRNLSSMKALRKESGSKSKSKSQNYSLRTGAVAAA